MRVKQFSLQDPETSLANRSQLETHLQSLVDHCANRGGGLALGLIEVNSAESKLRPGTLKTIANSLQLALRPMDLVSRLNVNTFAVSIFYQDPLVFNLEMFQRLISSIKRHTHETSDEGKLLQMSTGVWHSHNFENLPTVTEIISSAQNAIEVIE
jgi:PleD family two-component response regulator